MKNKQHVGGWVFFFMCVILTFVPYQGDNRLNITLLIGLLHHTEPILQVLKTLVVGDVVHQEDALHWKKKRWRNNVDSNTRWATFNLQSLSGREWLRVHSSVFS